jgi:hypothetical protein
MERHRAVALGAPQGAGPHAPRGRGQLPTVLTDKQKGSNMAHSDSGVEKARQLIRDAAADGNKTAQAMLKGVEKDERTEAKHGEDAVERP